MDERYFTIDEVAERLKVSASTIRRWIRLGELRRVELPGRTVRIPEMELRRLLAGTDTEGGPKPAPDASDA